MDDACAGNRLSVERFPQGTGDVDSARQSLTAEPDDLASFNRYTVKKGETISTIAKKLKVSRTDLAEANYLTTKARLDAGQQLIIPRAPTTILAARTATPAPVQSRARSDAVVASNVRPPAVECVGGERASRVVTHRVKTRGDTLLDRESVPDTVRR